MALRQFNWDFWETPVFTFTNEGVFPKGTVVRLKTGKDLAEVNDLDLSYKEFAGNLYVVDKYNQHKVMYLNNLDGTPVKELLGGGINSQLFEVAKEWKLLDSDDLNQLKVGTFVKINNIESYVTELQIGSGNRVIGFCTKHGITESNPKNFWGKCTNTEKIYTANYEWKQLSLEELKQLKKGDKIKIRDEENEVCNNAGGDGFLLKERFIDSRNNNSAAFAYSAGYNDHRIPVYKLTEIKLEDIKMTSSTFKKEDLKTGHRVTFKPTTSWNGEQHYTKIVFRDHCALYTHGEIGDFLVDPVKGTVNWTKFENLLSENILKVEVPNHPYDIFYHSSGWKTVWEKKTATPEQEAYEAALEQLELAKQKVEALNPNK